MRPGRGSIRFHRSKNPRELGEVGVRGFLSHLAVGPAERRRVVGLTCGKNRDVPNADDDEHKSQIKQRKPVTDQRSVDNELIKPLPKKSPG